MFSESQINHNIHKGSIEVICGSMFSGKTEELLRRIKRAEFANLKIAVFKPQIDKRYNKKNVVSHDKNTIQSVPVKNAKDIFLLANKVQVVAIDEAQFFNSELIKVCDKLANSGIRVIIAGLDMDFQGNPFGPIPALLAISEKITKVHAICTNFSSSANFSFRKNAELSLIRLGERKEYNALCRNCFNQLKIKN